MKSKLTPQILFCLVLSLFGFSSAMAQTYNVSASFGSVNRSIKDFYGYNTGSTVRVVSWNTPQLPNALKQLNASIYRFPAGAYSNWWDWKTGWFKAPDQMPPGVIYPGSLILDYQYDNSLEKLKLSIDATGAKPIFLLNMISSTLDDQIALLYHAQCIGLPVEYAELGKEFYDDDPAIDTIFPNAEVFAQAVYTWTKEIVKHFPNIKVGWNASFEYDRFTSPYHKKITWNKRVAAVLQGYGASFPMANSAPSMYIFYGSANGGGGLPITTTAQCDNLMKSGYSVLDHLKTIEVPHLAAFPEIWISEYNLMDNGVGVHGTWAHGLFSTLVGMRLLEENKMSKGLLHNMIGDFVYSSLFDTTDNFCTPGGYAFITPVPVGQSCSNYPTAFLQKSAQGNALAQMGFAMFDADNAHQINFTGAPLFTGTTYSKVYGFRFLKSAVSNSEQCVVLNLGNNTINLNVDTLGLNVNANYDQVAGSPYTPVQGNMTVTTGTVVNHLLTLPPYSITRIYPANVSALRAFATISSICVGNSTSLHARGASTYSWSPATGLSSTTGSDVLATPAASTTYTVTDNFGSTATVTITVAPQLTISVSGMPVPKACQGAPVTLVASGGTQYHWDPRPDSIATTNGSTVILNPKNSIAYTLYSAGGGCYCGENIVNLNVGGEVKLSSDRLVCENTAEQLVKGITNPGYSYSWTSSTGTLTSSLFSPVVTPTDTTAYYLQSTEAGCVYKDTLVLNTMECCTGNVTVTNGNADSLMNKVYALCSSCVKFNGTYPQIKNYSGTIAINGIFTLNQSLQFINCPNVTFNAAGMVDVKQKSKLILDTNTTFKDCSGKMWQGIYAYDGSSLVKVINGSTVKNAIIGVDVYNDTKLYIENANFINNHIGVNWHENLIKTFSGDMWGSTFKCTGANNMLPPYAGVQTYAHVIFKNAGGGDIGNTAKGQNIFKNAYYGLLTDNMQINVYNARFDTIRNAANTAGTAIVIDGTLEHTDDVSIGGTATNQGLQFNSCYTAVDASDNIVLKVKGNTFNSCSNGVIAYNCSDSTFQNTLDVSSNVFNNAGTAILLNMNSNSTITVMGNTITATKDKGIGISVNDLHNTTKSILSIKNNIINWCKTGIYLNQAGANGTIQGNTINVNIPTLTSTAKSYGIKNLNTDTLTISQNHINTNVLAQNYTNSRGIYLQNVNMTSLVDNNIRNFDQGITISGGGNSPTYLKCNILYMCYRGISLESNAIIGPQGDLANNITWQNSWQPSGWYNPAASKINYCLYSYAAYGNQSPFYTLGSYPYNVTTNGHTGKGNQINASVIPGTGIACNPVPAPVIQSNIENNNLYEISKGLTFANTIGFNPDHISNSGLTAKELEQLYELAIQCPEEAGVKVYDARAILSYYYKKVIDFDCDKLYEQTDETGLIDNSFNIYPNPAQKLMVVSLSEIQADVTIDIYDVLGNLVLSFHEENINQKAIDIVNLRNGVYLCKVKAGDKIFGSKKFTVAN
ncbi:MAG: T9SS type A sorting domain-containing protein [Bacteroidia bacterium]